jgi:hypothetical protein
MTPDPTEPPRVSPFRVKGVGIPGADAEALDLSPAEIRRRGVFHSVFRSDKK